MAKLRYSCFYVTTDEGSGRKLGTDKGQEAALTRAVSPSPYE